MSRQVKPSDLVHYFSAEGAEPMVGVVRSVRMAMEGNCVDMGIARDEISPLLHREMVPHRSAAQQGGHFWDFRVDAAESKTESPKKTAQPNKP